MSAVSERAAIVALVAGSIASGAGRFALDDPGEYSSSAAVDAADKIVAEAMRLHPVDDA